MQLQLKRQYKYLSRENIQCYKEKTKRRVSIIIPIYNGGQYIDDCMSYVLNQSYGDVEIVIVNDGSTDETKDKLEKYLAYENVTYIEQQNMGQSAARNRGIKAAKGEFLYFMDVDDKIERDTIQILEAKQGEKDSDLVIASMQIQNLFGQTYVQDGGQKEVSYSSKEKIKDFIYEYGNDVKSHRNLTSACNKLYRKSLIDEYDLYFDEEMNSGEDVPFVVRYMSFCDGIELVSNVLYTYNHYNRGIVSSRQKEVSELKVYVKWVSEFEKIFYEDSFIPFIGNLYSEYAIWTIFRVVQLSKIVSWNELKDLYDKVKEIILDQKLQESILFYKQKHDDNYRCIPFFIKCKQILVVIFLFKLQIHRTKWMISCKK